jgi:hypothetical protein
MLTINGLGKRKPYTYKEIVEIDYPDYWKAANESVLRADAIQEMMGKVLPIFHDHLPADTEKWKSEKAKNLLVNYLKLRTLYGFGHYIWETANRLCHELGKSSNDGDYIGVEKAKTGLKALFETINKVDVADIVQDQETGFEKLKQALGDTYIHVMAGRSSDGRSSTWSFRDIVGTLEYYETASIAIDPMPLPTIPRRDDMAIEAYNNLWVVALNSAVPTEPDIAGLMESEEDDKTVRMY